MSLSPKGSVSGGGGKFFWSFHGALKPLYKLGYKVYMNPQKKKEILRLAVAQYGAMEVYMMLYEAWIRNKRPRVREILEEDMRWVAKTFLVLK